MTQERSRRHSETEDEETNPAEPDETGQQRREKLGHDADDLLDEIDDVLEDNASDFVRAYVQKGGQ